MFEDHSDLNEEELDELEKQEEEIRMWRSIHHQMEDKLLVQQMEQQKLKTMENHRARYEEIPLEERFDNPER